MVTDTLEMASPAAYSGLLSPGSNDMLSPARYSDTGSTAAGILTLDCLSFFVLFCFIINLLFISLCM